MSRGVEVSRTALRNARKDFEEALELLAPGASKREVTWSPSPRAAR